MNLAEKVEIERRHPVVVGDAGEEVHQDQLTVTLATVSRLLLGRSFYLRAALDNNYGGRTTTSDGYEV